MLGFTGGIVSQCDKPDEYRFFSAVAVLLAWIRGMLSLGRHPKSTPITMFAHVLKTFLWLILWYSPLLVGFGLSFFFLFGGTNVKSNDFANVPFSMLKLSAMLVGEFDYSNLPFDSSQPIVSRIIFLAFLFFVAIVMINLLNGMAVSDTHRLRNKVLRY